MALIYCPNCGKQISDQAVQCPHCSYRLIKESSPVKKKPDKKKLIILSAVIISLLVVCTCIYFYMNALHVDYIRIQNWKYDSESSSENFDYYDAEIISNETKPFIAIINKNDGETSYPDPVPMEDGKAELRGHVDKDADPTKIYTIQGYMECKAVDESIIKEVKILEDSASYYDSDYTSSTSVTVDVEIELNTNWTGILTFDFENDINHEKEEDCYAAIVNGKGTYVCFSFDLPLKSRGIGFTITPKYFSKAASVKEQDYSVSKEYTLQQSKSSYQGTVEYTFDYDQDGYILYSKTLISGGDEEDTNVEKYAVTDLENGKATFTTYDSRDSSSLVLKPQYEFKIYGYVTWNTLQ